MPKYVFNSIRDDYMTPAWFIEKVLQDAGLKLFDCDVCCTEFNIPARYHYKKDGLYAGQKTRADINGLSGEWFNNNWCNPPFSMCDDFIKKAVEEQQKGHTTYMLIPARTETKYWQEYILKDGQAVRGNVKVIFLKKGLCFIDPDTGLPVQMNRTQKDGSKKQINGVYKNPLALIIFKGVNNFENN